ncbi:MAG TPA: phosphate signaling complex protein PhoU [Candidatus Blautia excrementipullorum]|nr:phosphate signaling complex protein PhoU [Candidatus Blautia excrementipullorum]
MATRFERQLEELHVQMITMGSLCEKVITLSAKAIEGVDCAKEVFDTDREIDAKEREIETLCMRLLLHQQPVAGDLREISAALRMISDMERIGDQAADIADLSRFVDKNCVQIPEEIKKMVELTVHMVTESVDSFVKSDIDLCRKVIADDDKVDEAFNQIKGELANLMYNNMDVKVGLDLLMAAKYMERIGDHAVNIAEWVEYSITGVHRNNEHQLGGNEG